MDYQTFDSKEDAEGTISRMLGWIAKAVQIQLPSPTDPQELVDTWVVECDGGLYLRDDGFIR
jgi:hypothetical protein